jgi:histidine triad (HIT) family protein
VETLIDLDQNELHNCIFTAQRVARAVMEATDSPGLNLLQNNHRCAHQEVKHVHFHVIPRKPDDGFSLGWRQQEYGEGEMEDLQQKIESRL